MRPGDEVRYQDTDAGLSHQQYCHLQLAWSHRLSGTRSAQDSDQPQTDSCLSGIIGKGEVGMGASRFRTAADGQIWGRNISRLLFD